MLPGVDPLAVMVMVPPFPVVALAVRVTLEPIDTPPLLPLAPRLVIEIVPPLPDVPPPLNINLPTHHYTSRAIIS